MSKPRPRKLNLGSGNNKLPGYVNIDIEATCKPDLQLDFINERLPYRDQSVDEVVLFHVIEHISKKLHNRLLCEIFRVLKVGGKFFLSYPNFWECAQRWHSNYRGLKEFFHNTMFGRQLYPSDYHVCAMDPQDLGFLMTQIGFEKIEHRTEEKRHNPWYTLTLATRGKHSKLVPYEDLVRQVTANSTIAIGKKQKRIKQKS